MALIKCSECGTEISDKAAACVKCGAPLQPVSINAVPVVIRNEPRFKWWLWGPLALVGGAILWVQLTPEYIHEANAFATVCKKLAGPDPIRAAECDRLRATRIIAAKQQQQKIKEAIAEAKRQPQEPAKDPEPWPSPGNLFEGQPEAVHQAIRRATYPELYKAEKKK